MNIAIIGVGGVGGYFGSKIVISKDKEDSVYFIARGEHLNKINESGLKVISNKDGESICYPSLATSEISKLPMLDMCMICVKGYDLEKVLEELKGKIKDTTQIIALLNGIDIYDRIRKIITSGFVYPACVYIGTHIEEPGVICQSGGQCRIIFGKDPEKKDSNADIVRTIFEKAGIDYSWSDDYMEAIWDKYMCIASYALVTAAYDKTMGEVYNDEELSRKLLEIMNVIYKISQKKDIKMTNDCIEKAHNKALDFPYESKTSFQRDYEMKQNRDEREIFGETLIRLAKEYNIDAKAVEEVYNKLT